MKSPKKLNSKALVFLALHVLLLVYSLCGFFSKHAAQSEFLSPAFFGFYFGVFCILGIYAIGWQQILKRLPLTLAFANKAIIIVWGMFWGVIFFNEHISLPMIIGAIMVISGVILFGVADGEQLKAEAEAQAQPAVEAEDGDE